MGIKSRHSFRCEHASANRRPITVGFAAETEEIIKISDKLEKKEKIRNWIC